VKDEDRQMVRWITACFAMLGYIINSGPGWKNQLPHNANAAVDQADALLETLGIHKEESNDGETK
jgi:hypothetical protein